MTIELATAEDAAEILALQKLAYLSEAAICGDFRIQPLTQTLEDLLREFGTHTVFKAVQEGRIIGSVRTLLRQETCCVGKLIVHPELQNRGLGTALIRHLEEYHNQAACFELFTGDKSLRNLYLYAKHGYREFKREQVNDHLWLVYMKKCVGRIRSSE